MKVHEIFRSIQGEGSLSGTPMTFVRLYGCNLSCPNCDQPQPSHCYTEMVLDDIVKIVEDEWVCITGGEPTIHKGLQDFVYALLDRGYYVALETNGTNAIPDEVDWVCISPKNIWPSEDILIKADEVKLVVGSDMYDAGTKLLDMESWNTGDAVVSVQPWWDENYENNLVEALELSQLYQVNLSIQLHKYLGVR